jgi:hypothetical protein
LKINADYWLLDRLRQYNAVTATDERRALLIAHKVPGINPGSSFDEVTGAYLGSLNGLITTLLAENEDLLAENED